jgi:hypothetical protein
MRIDAVPARILLVMILLTSACRRGAPSPLVPDLGELLGPGESLMMLRRVPSTPQPGSPGALGAEHELLIAVVREASGKVELRVGEQRTQGLIVAHASSAGDEFRNLAVEDVNGDGRPEMVSFWTGGQLAVVEVLGRNPAGAWAVLLQDAGQIVEERHLPDGTLSFWITSRTYEEESQQPPVYQTTVFRWDGSRFSPVPS